MNISTLATGAALFLASVSVASAAPSPTAPSQVTNATTVHVSQTERKPNVSPAPLIHIRPSATDTVRNASTVHQTGPRNGAHPAPRVNVSPSAPD